MREPTAASGRPLSPKHWPLSAGQINASRWRPLAFAIAVHAGLVVALFFGVAWKTSDDCKNGIAQKPGFFEEMWDSVRIVVGLPPKPRKDCGIQVEMWAPSGSQAAKPIAAPRTPAPAPSEPLEPPEAPMPKPVMQAEAKPEPKVIPEPVKPPAPLPAPALVQPPAPAPPPRAAPVREAPEMKPTPKPDLALERAKAEREKAEREKVERAKAEREKTEREKAAREKVEREKAEREKSERAKAEREKAEREKAEREKAEREKAERDKSAREKREREEKERARAEQERLEREKLEREKVEREKLERERIERERLERQKAEREANEREKLEREQRRQRDFARDIAKSQAEAGEVARANPGGGGSGGPSSTASASGPRIAEWQSLVGSRIRDNTSFVAPPDLTGNPQVLFRATLAPDCTLVRLERLSSSGLATWDRAAESAIRKTNPFPRFPGGNCPPSIDISRRPND